MSHSGLRLDNPCLADFRIVYTAGPKSGSFGAHDWYGLHLLETNSKATAFLTQIRDWLVAHPTEVLTMWISRHGDACAKGDAQYPGISNQVKQAFWAKVKDVLGPLLFALAFREPVEALREALLPGRRRGGGGSRGLSG